MSIRLRKRLALIALAASLGGTAALAANTAMLASTADGGVMTVGGGGGGPVRGPIVGGGK
jgi:hypothetical protein